MNTKQNKSTTIMLTKNLETTIWLWFSAVLFLAVSAYYIHLFFATMKSILLIFLACMTVLASFYAVLLYFSNVKIHDSYLTVNYGLIYINREIPFCSIVSISRVAQFTLIPASQPAKGRPEETLKIVYREDEVVQLREVYISVKNPNEFIESINNHSKINL